MGVNLAAVGAGPKADSPVVSWSGDVSFGKDEIANASAYPDLRVVQQASVSLVDGPTEHASTGGGWFRPSPANMGGFSAVCWMFGRRLQAQLNVPVGLIENQVGGTAVERWSSTAALAQCNQTRAGRMATCKGGTGAEAEAAAAGAMLGGSVGTNSTLYNGMIHPWINTAVRGAIW